MKERPVMPALNPCPFCGVRGHGNVQLQHRCSLPTGWQVLCLSCGARGPNGDHDDAVDRWNHRSGDSAREVERG
ncbi:TPA: Lar family restriction alleviation protein [Serratia marcescens]|nr:Lar family restriction alleviation protein [Serratia marcescens]